MSGFEALGVDIGAPISVIVVAAAPGTRVRLHRHPYPEVFAVTEGEATYRLGDETRVVREGEIVVAPAGVPHGFENTGAGVLRQTDVHCAERFDTEWLEPL